MSPTWQRTPCPGWCSRGHREDDQVEDRIHRSVGIAVEVRDRRLVHTDPFEHTVGAREYEIGILQVDGASEVWVYLGSGPDAYLEFSAESAVRVLGALSTTVGMLLGGTEG